MTQRGFLRKSAKRVFMTVCACLVLLAGLTGCDELGTSSTTAKPPLVSSDISSQPVSSQEESTPSSEPTSQVGEVLSSQTPSATPVQSKPATVTSKPAENKTPGTVASKPAGTTVTPQKPSATPSKAPAINNPKPPQSQMVWVVSKGKKYHSSPSCSNMKNPYQVTIENAKSSGRTPCSKCY